MVKQRWKFLKFTFNRKGDNRVQSGGQNKLNNKLDLEEDIADILKQLQSKNVHERQRTRRIEARIIEKNTKKTK